MSNNSFIGINDFYNFIRKDNGKNSPTTFYYFTVMFYRENVTTFTGLNDANLERLRYAIQKIDLPKSVLKGYENNQITEAVGNIDNIYGAYTFLKNVYFNTDSKNITMRILNMQYPVIEEVIYPWFYNCVKNEWDNGSAYSTSFPKLSMVIRFWGGNNVESAKNNLNSHVFEYFVSGLFPINIENYNPAHATTGDDNRSVTFAFNEFRAYLKGNESTWYKSRTYGPQIVDLNTKKPIDQTKINIPTPEELAAKKAEEERKAAQQAAEAHRWFQDVLSKAAGAAAGYTVKESYKSNILKNNKQATSKTSSKPQQTVENIVNNNSSKIINSNNNIGSDLNKNDVVNIDSNLVNNNIKTNNNSSINETNVDLSVPASENKNDMGSLTINDAMNLLNQERNASSTDSNMSLAENEILVEAMNVDNEFGIILDSEDENETATSNNSENIKSSSSVNDVDTNLEISDNINSNDKDTYITKDDLSSLDNVKTNNKKEQSLNDIDTSVEIKSSKNEQKSKNDLEIFDNINSNKIDTYITKDALSSLDNIKTNNKKEQSLNDIDTSVEIKSSKNEQKSKDEVSNMSLETLNSISENLNLSDVSGSFLNIQKFISKNKSKDSDYFDVNLQSSLNEQQSSAIKSNMSLEENRELVETITVDDEFGEILDSEDEFETAKETLVDEYKNTNSIEIETKLDELSSTIENNNLNLVKNINSSELNLENAKENWKETLNLIDKNKSNTINLKKDLLDNYTSDTLNNNYGSIESKQLSDIVNEKLNSINSIKENSENNIETLSSKYLDNLNNRKNKNDELISSKFEVLENYSTNVNNKTDEIEPVKGYNHSKFDIEVKTSNKEDEIKENDSKIIDSIKFKNAIKNDVKDTSVKKNDLETLKKHYSKSNHYVLNNEDANKIYNLLKNNKILNVETYNYLNSYADIKKIDIKDIVREYKSKKENDLDDFIYDLIKSTLKIESNTVVNSPLNATQKLTLDQQGYKIKNDVTLFEVKNNKIIPIVKNDQKITNDDINDLFS